jgi:hypothetical protein
MSFGISIIVRGVCDNCRASVTGILVRYEADTSLKPAARLSTAGIIMQRALDISLQTMKIHGRDVPTDFVCR